MMRFTYRLLVLLVASVPLENVYSVPGSGSVTKLLGLATGVAWGIAVLARGGLRAPHTLHLVALLFVVWNASSLLWTIDTDATQVRVKTYAQLFVLLLVVWDTVRTGTAVRQVLVAYLLGCFAAAVMMIGGYVVHGASGEAGRVTLGNFNPNDAATILALGLPVACYLLATWRGRYRRQVTLLAGTYLPLGFVAVMTTGSRAAVVALLPALWYAARLLGRSRPGLAVVTFVGLGAMAVAALPLLPPGSVQRLVDTGNNVSNGNLNQRQDVWAEAFRIIGDSPWAGVGAGAFRTAATAINKVGHNFVLALLAEIGVVGLALFLMIMWVSARAVLAAPRALRELWLTILLAWTFTALLHNWEYRKLTWLMFGLMVACGTLAREPEPDPARRKRARPVAAPARE